MFYQEIENGSLPTLKYITATIEKNAPVKSILVLGPGA